MYTWMQKKYCFHSLMFAVYVMHLEECVTTILLLDEACFSLPVRIN